MSTATTWTAEFERAGRVEFRPRRRRLLIRLAIGLALMVSSTWSNVQHLLDGETSGALGVLRVTALAAFVYLVGLTGWQLVAMRPVVTIDGTGISLGRSERGRLGWHQISRIDDPSGIPGLRTVQVQPTERRVNPVGIPQDNVADLHALSHWLRTLHARQQSSDK